MAVISFSNVGKTVQARAIEEPAVAPVPIGIVTPLRKGIAPNDGIFAMNYTSSEQIRDNLRNLVLTNWGERPGLYDFGANLRELALEVTARDTFENEVMQRIKLAVGRWMPFVSLRGFELSQDFEDRGRVGAVSFTITYDVPIINDLGKALEIVLLVA